MNDTIARPVIAMIATLVIAGCVSAPVGNRTESPARSQSTVADPPVTTESPVPEVSGLQSVLRDRRRSDFPEIQTSETGFTITEKVRIGGNIYALYEDALSELAQERYTQGIALLERITADAPELTAPFVELGIAYSRVGNLESAATALETAAALSPEHPIVRNELGIVYRRLGRFAESRSEYEKALAVFSDFHFARRNLAVLCDLYLADPQCALQNYRAYLDLAGEDPEVEIWVADLTSRLNQQ